MSEPLRNPYPKGSSAHALWAATIAWGKLLGPTVPLVRCCWRWGVQRPR